MKAHVLINAHDCTIEGVALGNGDEPEAERLKDLASSGRLPFVLCRCDTSTLRELLEHAEAAAKEQEQQGQESEARAPARPGEVVRGRRPSVGKKGVDGKYMVEVINHSGTRTLARRFKTEDEGKDFFDRAVAAHQQKVNREQRRYVVAFFETKSVRSAEVDREIATATLLPHR